MHSKLVALARSGKLGVALLLAHFSKWSRYSLQPELWNSRLSINRYPHWERTPPSHQCLLNPYCVLGTMTGPRAPKMCSVISWEAEVIRIMMKIFPEEGHPPLTWGVRHGSGGDRNYLQEEMILAGQGG